MLALMTVGDWSDDGHGKTKVIRIEHNLASNKDLERAYEAGVLIFGHDFKEVAARHYQDRTMPTEVYERLKELNFVDDEDWVVGCQADALWENKGKWIVPCPEAYTQIWLQIAKLGNPELIWEYPKRSYADHVNIGGYGLFH